jgi:hypothetical protein
MTDEMPEKQLQNELFQLNEKRFILPTPNFEGFAVLHDAKS